MHVSAGVSEVSDPPGARGAGSCEPPKWVLRIHLSPLQEHFAPLTAEPALPSPKLDFSLTLLRTNTACFPFLLISL